MDEVKIAYHYLKLKKINNPVMLDVGAHTGGAFYNFAKDGWKVFAFEPNPLMNEKIRENVAKWNLSNVEIFDKAVSDKDDQELDFYTSNESTGISSLVPFHSSHQKALKVKTLTLSKFLKEKDISNVNFLKVDVEGNDFKVLQGLNWDLVQPEVVVVEYEDRKTKNLGIGLVEILNFLQSKDYFCIVSEWEPIVKYGVSHTWKQFLIGDAVKLYNPKGWGNIIAVKNIDHSLFLSAIQKNVIHRENNLMHASSEKVLSINTKNSELFRLVKMKMSRKIKYILKKFVV